MQMGRGLGRLQRNVIGYLENKAKNCEADSTLTVQAYANLQEITSALGESSDAICQALSALIRRGWVKIYPNNRRRDRYYGTSKLPQLTSIEINSLVNNLLAKQ
jgi:hypothetical protein